MPLLCLKVAMHPCGTVGKYLCIKLIEPKHHRVHLYKAHKTAEKMKEAVMSVLGGQ